MGIDHVPADVTPLDASECLIPDWQPPARVRAVFTTRAGGVSTAPFDAGRGTSAGATRTTGDGLNLAYHVGDDRTHVANNRARFSAYVGHGRNIAWLEQVHGSEVVHASADAAVDCMDAALAAAGATARADASVTDDPAACCVVMVADCLPVLLADRAGRAVGAAHAGWRGLADGVIERAVDALRRTATGSVPAAHDDVVAWLGPAIGPQAFEVGAEVREQFLARAQAHEQAETLAAFQPGQRDGKYFCDLYRLARLRLLRKGIEDVSGGGFCTVSEPRFYSYRRDGRTGRMAAAIWLA
ncbi:peptidoglycan editing factor PgeF [Chitinasiproducens palmae]|uniref:Purine nucleoside phosphorylase n=1 Tax=Chitinasiproducens palmae TaxID=1770053 RepID=A0A1H2PVT1_9BURK|nr:peptidoglycan editing factor PgeF [Chitinasiproducens palmae]SDV51398.1 conserved hypothetical protein [Chitinasiproducens palmae]